METSFADDQRKRAAHIDETRAIGAQNYSKVREITRVACPATEDYLLMIAIHGTAHHVERLVRYYRHAKESEELTREQQQQANRSLQYFYDHDGSLVIKARLPAQAGALLMKAIDAAVKDLWETEPEAVEADTPAGTPTVKFLPTRTKRADALELLAESFLQNARNVERWRQTSNRRARRRGNTSNRLCRPLRDRARNTHRRRDRAAPRV